MAIQKNIYIKNFPMGIANSELMNYTWLRFLLYPFKEKDKNTILQAFNHQLILYIFNQSWNHMFGS